MRPSPQSPLRLLGYAAVLWAMAFAQAGHSLVADTKFDLVTGPARFLAKGQHLWDPLAAFGQVQNQAYGYAWPMGPFFLLGHVIHFPMWAVQRAWFAVLLCVAFFGILALGRALRLGGPTTQVVAAFAYVLTPRITTLIGGASIEVWPMAIAPWVLWALVRGSESGSVRRWAALAALFVATAGGVNAIAVAAVLPLGVIWVLTRRRGPRKWRLAGWWTLFTGLATFWWWGPLLLMGKYAAPFLDYIENATITTLPTDLDKTFLGLTNWVAYFSGGDYPGGHLLATTAFLVLDAALVAGVGLAGVLWGGHPHRRFLVLGVLTGVGLVGFGYAGELSGFWAADRMDLLDGALAPLRNLHKFDLVLRIPLVLGLAHALTRLAALRGDGATKITVRVVAASVGLALVALAAPWFNGQITPRHAPESVPAYWSGVADWLHTHDDGTVALEVPASTFGIYRWGNTHDDVLQGLATSPWAVRNVIPLAEPGNVVMLDAITQAVESGRPDPELAAFLAANGVGRLVVRNDLDRFSTATPAPAYVRAALSDTPGLSLEQSFGPRVGGDPQSYGDDGRTRLVAHDGIDADVGSVDVYRVEASASAASISPIGALLVGDPGSGLAGAGSARVLAADAGKTQAHAPLVLTDGMKRREMAFGGVRQNESATLTAGADWTLPGKEHQHRVLDDQGRWSTVAQWSGGVSGVRASSSQSDADATPPLERGEHPGAALDRDRSTAWSSDKAAEPVGQWWQVDFDHVREVSTVSIALARTSAAVPYLDLSVGGRTKTVPAPRPGTLTRYRLDLPAGSSLRVTASGRPLGAAGSFQIAEVDTGLTPTRWLRLPTPPLGHPVQQVVLRRDRERSACVTVGTAYNCSRALRTTGEDGERLARRVSLPEAGDFRLRATVSLRRTGFAGRALLAQRGGSVRATMPFGADVATRAYAMVDRDPGTTWVGRGEQATLRVTFPRPVRLRDLDAVVHPAAPAAQPRTIELRAGDRRRTVRLDQDGHARLPDWTVRRLRIEVLTTVPTFTVDGAALSPAPVGISSLRINGREPGAHPGGRVHLSCGQGPRITVDGRVLQTSLDATVRELMRGESVPVTVCAGDLDLASGTHDLSVAPTGMLRAEELSLDATGADRPDHAATSLPLTLRRDDRGMPESVIVPYAEQTRVVTIAQNASSGFRATLDGHRLHAQRVDGWQQGWIVPAGASGELSIDFAPAGSFRLALGVGAGLLALVALAAALPSRLRRSRRTRATDLPVLAPARPGLIDLVTFPVVAGLLGGWTALATLGVGAVVALALRRRTEEELSTGAALVSGLALLVATLGLTWSRLSSAAAAGEWTQLCSFVVLGALTVGVLVSTREDSQRRAKATFFRRSSGRSSR